jgi:hypothetical protein
MKTGDLIVVCTSLGSDPVPALVVEVSGDGYVRVLTEGQVIWVPVSYTDVIDEAG